MATVIRLRRGGRTHVPYYRVVVMDSRGRARGRVVDQIGYYHPCAHPAPVAEIDAAKALDWLRKGAQPTDTVREVLSKKGLMAAFAENRPIIEPAASPQEAAPSGAAPETPPAAAEAVEVASEAASEDLAEEAPTGATAE